MNGSLVEHNNLWASMQSMCYMVKAMGHVFKHLKVQELLSASRVNPAWNLIAMNKVLVSCVQTYIFTNFVILYLSLSLYV